MFFVLYDLDKKVFGKMTAKEVIGEIPHKEDLQKNLESELSNLCNNLREKSKEDLERLLKNQLEVEKLINSRPGAMALAQNKIQLYTEYSKKYRDSLKESLKNY